MFQEQNLNRGNFTWTFQFVLSINVGPLEDKAHGTNG